MTTKRPIRYLLAAITCFVLALLLVLFAGCARQPDRVTVQPLEVVNGQTVDEWIEDLEQNPPRRDPLQPYGFKAAPSTWTGWNKVWLAAGIGGQAADAATTIDALDGGNCREVNPLLGDDPDEGLIVGVKVAAVGLGLWITEYWLADHPRQRQYRNWIYGSLAVAGGGAALWNASQSCE